MPRIRRDRSPKKGSDWPARCVTVWEEDDVRPPDGERLPDAYQRITGLAYRSAATLDTDDSAGDCIMDLETTGWVVGYCCGLGFLAVVAESFD